MTHAVILPMHRLRIYNNRTIISSIAVVLGDMSLLKCQFENLIVALVGDTAAIIYATFVSILNNMYRMLVITVYLAMEENGRGQKEE